MRRLFWRKLWCSGLGRGYLKPAPGTWGSAVAVLIWWFLLAELPVWQQLLVIALYTTISLMALYTVVRESEVTDPGWTVVDEFAGQWLALVAAPQNIWVVLLAFGLFRLFDITKPWVVGYLDRSTKGARGVMADDLAAGLLAAAVLHIALLAFGASGLDLRH
ncbi:MAG: phosphatidylglycerophosphatase A [Gammaproteobacteria bacterium]|nr:phosphatidylglycerophosphatase A [Gammaproteobacteria bacterium]